MSLWLKLEKDAWNVSSIGLLWGMKRNLWKGQCRLSSQDFTWCPAKLRYFWTSNYLLFWQPDWHQTVMLSDKCWCFRHFSSTFKCFIKKIYFSHFSHYHSNSINKWYYLKYSSPKTKMNTTEKVNKIQIKKKPERKLTLSIKMIWLLNDIFLLLPEDKFINHFLLGLKKVCCWLSRTVN